LNGASKTFDTIFFVKADVARFPGPKLQAWSLGITGSDTIQLVNPPPSVRDWLHGWIPKAWPRGYSFTEDDGRVSDSKPPTDVGTCVQSLIFSLKGKPFQPAGHEEELHTTVFIGGLMTALRGLGWDVLASTSTTNGTTPRNIWYLGNLRECFHFSGKLSKASFVSVAELGRAVSQPLIEQTNANQPPVQLGQTVQLGSGQIVIPGSVPVNLVSSSLKT